MDLSPLPHKQPTTMCGICEHNKKSFKSCLNPCNDYVLISRQINTNKLLRNLKTIGDVQGYIEKNTIIMKLQTIDFFRKHRKNILIHLVNISETTFKKWFVDLYGDHQAFNLYSIQQLKDAHHGLCLLSFQ